MQKTYIGIDNGVTGSVGIIKPNGDIVFFKTPIKKWRNYTKEVSYINRINREELRQEISRNLVGQSFALLEKPLTSKTNFRAVMSGQRAFEATLCMLDDMMIKYSFVNSREWQKELLPGVKGSALLKDASRDWGNNRYQLDTKHPDADGLLIAWYARMMNY